MTIYPATLGQLRDAVERMIRACGPGGEDAPCAGHAPGSSDRGEILDDALSVRRVWIDDKARVVSGDDDYRPRPGERVAVLVC